MTKVWKFVLTAEDEFTVSMPLGSVPLSVGFWQGDMVVWAMVNGAEDRLEQRRFSLRGTGHPRGAASGCHFMGSLQIEVLGLVFHVFDAGVVV